MTRTLIQAGIVAALVLATLPSSASAQDGMAFGLRAVVQPFCKIRSEIGDRSAAIVDGAIELGNVREVCNTQGYKIDVQLINVASGTLQHGSDSQELDDTGHTQIQWYEARARTAAWRVTRASLRQTDSPVYMRISISPI